MGYDKYGDIHNQYYSSQDAGSLWINSSNANRCSASNGLSIGGNSVQMGGTLTTSSSVTNTTTRMDFSRQSSTWEGYSGCAGPRGSAGTLGHPGIFAGQSKAISYKDLSGLSNFSSSSRKPTKGSMGNNIKR